MMVDKRGSHVGVIISFMVFMGFLVFLYPVLIEPAISVNQDNQLLLNRLKLNLIENVSSEFKTLSINVDQTSESCVRLDNFITDMEVNSRLTVRDGSGNPQTAYVVNDDLEIVKTSSGNNFFKVYNSQDFDELSNTGQSPCNFREYSLGLVKEEERVSEKKIIELISYYENDYDSLKSSLELPDGNGFDFIFTYENKTDIGIREDISVDVYAEEFSLQYFNKNGGINPGNINLRVW